MRACIYSIKNNINNHEYIGQTINFAKRKSKHLTALRGGYHCNSHLQRAWNKYGEENFSFSIIEEIIDYTTIGERERFWIEKRGYYNIDKGREGFTPIALRKMSEAHLGKISSRRVLEKEDVLLILAIGYFLDCVERPLAKIYGISREVTKNLLKRKTYLDISEEFDSYSFSQKFELFKKGIVKLNYDPWQNTNFSCPKKNAYFSVILQTYFPKYTYEKIGKWFGITKEGIKKIKHELLDTHEREIDTNFNKEELIQIVLFLLENTTSCEAVSLLKRNV